MGDISKEVEAMRANPRNVRFSTLKKVCDSYFDKPRSSGSSHFVYKTPWSGDPRVNIQNKGGYAKPYQVKQVLQAIERIEELKG